MTSTEGRDERLGAETFTEPPSVKGNRPSRTGFESPYPTAISQTSRTGWALIDHIVWHGITLDGDQITIEAKPPEETDFASSPPGMWSLFPPYGEYTAATIIHDHCWRVLVPAGLMTYREADNQLYLMLRASRVSRLRSGVMWAAVRWASLIKPGGRQDWWRDAPAVLGLSMLALPVVAVVEIVNVVARILFVTAEYATDTIFDYAGGRHDQRAPGRNRRS